MQDVFQPVAGSVTPVVLRYNPASVRVDSGSNWVSINPAGLLVQPGTSGFVASLTQWPVQAWSITVTAPPPGVTPVGPAQQTQSTITFSDQTAPESPGALTIPQTVATGSGLVTAALGLTIDTGLARALSLALYNPTAGSISMNIEAQQNGVGVIWISGAIAAGTLAPFGFGQGFVNNFALGFSSGLNAAFSMHLPQFVTIAPSADGLTADYRLYY